MISKFSHHAFFENVIDASVAGRRDWSHRRGRGRPCPDESDPPGTAPTPPPGPYTSPRLSISPKPIQCCSQGLSALSGAGCHPLPPISHCTPPRLPPLSNPRPAPPSPLPPAGRCDTCLPPPPAWETLPFGVIHPLRRAMHPPLVPPLPTAAPPPRRRRRRRRPPSPASAAAARHRRR